MDRVRIICLVLGITGIVLFILPLVRYGILCIGNGTGLLIGGALLCCGIWYEPIKRLITWMLESRLGNALVGLVICMVVSGVLLACVISFCMVRTVRKAPEGNPTLVVLGCQVKKGRPSLMLKERLDAARSYLEAHEDCLCILSGGRGEDEEISEAQCMYQYLLECGIPEERLVLEDRSVSTRENLQFTQEILRERELDGQIAIVTNEFHEYRAFLIADKLGIDTTAVPARTYWQLFPTYLVREWYGVVYEWVGLEH